MLRGIEDIYEVSVAGLPDDKWVEIVAAFVVPMPGSSLTEAIIVDYCRDRIAGYKKPRKVFFLDELPRNPSGKVLRRELRDTYSKITDI